MKTALLASYGKDEPLLRLAKLLTQNDWALVGSAGTAKFLNENNIRCEDVAILVGAPIFGHRVVTLARQIYAGLLATPADDKELADLGVPRIDLVYVTLYPLEATIADPKSTPDDVIEKTDIGGPTLLRAAAKGRRLAISDPAQIHLIEAWFNHGCPEDTRMKLALRLAAAAERCVANYVDASARYWESKVK